MPPLLAVEDVRAGYGRVAVLHGVSFRVPEGSVVALLGPNGVGKTTTMRVVAGLLEPWSGRVRFAGEPTARLSPHDIARRGVGLIPEGRAIFPALTVRENVEMQLRACGPPRRERLEAVFDIFPVLRDRMSQRAGTLSGGEQQILAVARAFLAAPRLLLVDELSMGLAPRLVQQLFEALDEVRRQGTTILMVEQYLSYALRAADVVYLMAKGRIVFAGEPAELRRGERIVSAYLGA